MDIAINLSTTTDRILDQLDNGQRTINYGVNDAVTAGYALVAADDGKSGPAPKRELARLTACSAKLEALARANPAPKDASDKGEVTQKLLATMTSIRGVIRSQASFPTDRPEVAQARALMLTLGNTRFQRRRRRDTWLAANRLIVSVDENAALAAQLELLVGPWAIETLRPLHARAGQLLGITAALTAPVDPALLAHLRQHRDQAAAYERAVLGEMDAQDQESVRRARDLLAPLVKLREEMRMAQAKSGGAEEEEEEEEEEKKEQVDPQVDVPATPDAAEVVDVAAPR